MAKVVMFDEGTEYLHWSSCDKGCCESKSTKSRACIGDLKMVAPPPTRYLIFYLRGLISLCPGRCFQMVRLLADTVRHVPYLNVRLKQADVKAGHLIERSRYHGGLKRQTLTRSAIERGKS
ncbi:hypothetical protein Tco_1175435 [Tanacetum coccineum]